MGRQLRCSSPQSSRYATRLVLGKAEQIIRIQTTEYTEKERENTEEKLITKHRFSDTSYKQNAAQAQYIETITQPRCPQNDAVSSVVRVFTATK